MAAFGLGGIGTVGPAEPIDHGETPFVCTQVVLAIDGSGSTRGGTFRRQIEGLQAVFGQERLFQAIQDCLPGSVAFAVTTWSGADEQDLCLEWAVVASGAAGRHLAERLEACRYFGGTTDIGRAVDHALRLLERSPFASYYRGVFLLTNGRTDRGAEASVAAARAEAAGAGVTVAAYALLRHRPEHLSPFYVGDALQLERYVAEHVSAGPRAFTAHARPGDDVETLLRALIEMLRQEVG